MNDLSPYAVLAGVLPPALFIGCLLLYATPSRIANKRNHKFSDSITTMNFFFGWTGLGWLAALVWACNNDIAREEKACPDCAENVLEAANVCRFCGHKFMKAEAGTS